MRSHADDRRAGLAGRVRRVGEALRRFMDAEPSGTHIQPVIVGSDMSLRGLPGLSSYASSKAAVLGLVRCAALELARVLSPAVLVGSPSRPELRPVIAGLGLVGLVEAQRQALADAED